MPGPSRRYCSGMPGEETVTGIGASIDRNAEVPLGVQLGWALRAAILEGRFPAGGRLPALRELAEAAGINVNTARAVYQRLDREGLVESRQGSGTFVRTALGRRDDVGLIAASAAHQASEYGVDPREVAAALYTIQAKDAGAGGGDAARRRALRLQVGVLEQALGELQSSGRAATASPIGRTGSTSSGPALQTVEQLQETRDELVRRLASSQGALDEPVDGDPATDLHPARAPGTPTGKRTITGKAEAKPGGRIAARPATASG